MTITSPKSVKELVEKTGRSVEPMKEGPMRDGFIKTVAKKRAKEDSDNEGKGGKWPYLLVVLWIIGFLKLECPLFDVLNKHEVDVEVPAGQVCCGSPLIRTGQTDILDELVRKNAKALEGYDTIITVCAGCGATLKRDYPEHGVKLNVMDISEYLVDKLNTKDMKPVNMRVTYHDPCHLIRGQGISEEPREILNKIKGVEFVEMEVPDRVVVLEVV